MINLQIHPGEWDFCEADLNGEWLDDDRRWQKLSDEWVLFTILEKQSYHAGCERSSNDPNYQYSKWHCPPSISNYTMGLWGRKKTEEKP